MVVLVRISLLRETVFKQGRALLGLKNQRFLSVGTGSTVSKPVGRHIQHNGRREQPTGVTGSRKRRKNCIQRHIPSDQLPLSKPYPWNLTQSLNNVIKYESTSGWSRWLGTYTSWSGQWPLNDCDVTQKLLINTQVVDITESVIISSCRKI